MLASPVVTTIRHWPVANVLRVKVEGVPLPKKRYLHFWSLVVQPDNMDIRLSNIRHGLGIESAI
jgi:hypothetical protein